MQNTSVSGDSNTIPTDPCSTCGSMRSSESSIYIFRPDRCVTDIMNTLAVLTRFSSTPLTTNSADAVDPSLLRSSSHSSPRWYHLQSLSPDVVLVSPLYVAKPHQSCFPVPLCDTLYLPSLPDVIVSRMVSWRMAACPSAHLHFCHFQFLHVGDCDWPCPIPYSIAG